MDFRHGVRERRRDPTLTAVRDVREQDFDEAELADSR